MSDKTKNMQLAVVINDDVLSISVGVELLLHATVEGGANRFDPNPNYRIIDREGFAKDILNQLMSEEEDGTTCVHLMLDKAVVDMVNSGGSLNVEFEDD